MTEKTQVIIQSLGGGIQSTAMALMLEDGTLPDPKPHASIYADTGSEPPHVYETLEWLAQRISWPINKVQKGNLTADTWAGIQKDAGTTPPAGTRWNIKLPLKMTRGGLLDRRCTEDYKINEIRREIRRLAAELAGVPDLHASRILCTQYIGISADEIHRIKPSRRAYIDSAYPLVDARYTRNDCQRYLDQHHQGHPTGRSACYYCPFHSLEEWRTLKTRYPDLWEDAVQMDAALRNKVEGGLTRHPGGLTGLLEADNEQGRLWGEEQWGNECTGVCGV